MRKGIPGAALRTWSERSPGIYLSGAGLLADVSSGNPTEQALCEEVICDELGLYACIAGCLERWGGTVRDGKFAFTGDSSRGDLWGGTSTSTGAP